MASASTSCTPFSAWKRARALAAPLAAPAPPCQRRGAARRSSAGHPVSPDTATALSMGAAGWRVARVLRHRHLAGQRAAVPAPAKAGARKGGDKHGRGQRDGEQQRALGVARRGSLTAALMLPLHSSGFSLLHAKRVRERVKKRQTNVMAVVRPHSGVDGVRCQTGTLPCKPGRGRALEQPPSPRRPTRFVPCRSPVRHSASQMPSKLVRQRRGSVSAEVPVLVASPSRHASWLYFALAERAAHATRRHHTHLCRASRCRS